MAKIFIDAGSYHGDQIIEFYRQHPSLDNWQVYGFEPDPEAFGILKKRITWPNTTLINKAVGPQDGEAFLYHGEGMGSTMLPGKQTAKVDYKHPIKVQMIDFVKWLQKHTADNDFINITMNIEGMEYQVLNRLIESGLIYRIDKLYIEFHAKKFGGEIGDVFKYSSVSRG